MAQAKGLRSRMQFPGNRIFPGNIWEKSHPEHPRPATSRPVSFFFFVFIQYFRLFFTYPPLVVGR